MFRSPGPRRAKKPAATAASHPEGRAHRRHYTTLRVAKLASGDVEGLGIVRNVSEGGMMIEARAPLDIGAPVTVSLFDGQKLDARIVWRKATALGLQFERPVTVDMLLTIPDRLENGKPPRLPRVRANRSAIMDLGHNQVTVTQIADISQRGARILTGLDLKPLQDIWLWPTGAKPMRGTVRWCRDGAAGIAFHAVLGLDDVAAWISDMPPQDEPPAR